MNEIIFLRSVGLLIDLVIVLLGSVGILILLFLATFVWFVNDEVNEGIAILGLLLLHGLFYLYLINSILFGWYYFWKMETPDDQATFGKKAMGLKVVNSEGVITSEQATIRFFGKFISALVLFCGFLVILKGETSWHDRMAGTSVLVKDV